MTNGRNRVSPAEAAAAMAGFPIRVTAFSMSYIFLRGFLASHPTNITSYVQKVGKQQSRYRRKSVTKTGGVEGKNCISRGFQGFYEKVWRKSCGVFSLATKIQHPTKLSFFFFSCNLASSSAVMWAMMCTSAAVTKTTNRQISIESTNSTNCDVNRG